MECRDFSSFEVGRSIYIIMDQIQKNSCVKKISQFNNKDIFLTSLISSFIVGIMAHGMAIFNKISFHDDFLLGSSAGITSGRWGGAILDKVLNRFMWEFLSTPVFFGFISLALFSFASFFICDLFEIEDKITVSMVSGLLVAFPAVTSCFGYMFMIHTYAFAIMLTIAATACICKARDYRISIPMCFIICFAIGIYQAVIAIAVSVFIGYMLFISFKKTDYSYIDFIHDSIYYAINSFCFFSLYMIILKVLLKIEKKELSDYQSVSSMGKDGILSYVLRVKTAYARFFYPEINNQADLFPMMVRYLYYIIVIIVISVIIYMLFSPSFEQKNKKFSIVLTMMLPIVFNFIYIMVDEDKTFIYSIMLYSSVFIFVLSCILTEKLKKKLTNSKIVNFLRIVNSGVILIILISYVRYANMCYTKALIMQEQAKSYYNTLISRITSTEGYSTDLPVMYVNSDKKQEELEEIGNFKKVTIPPYGANSIINSYSWRDFMRVWCGYKPEEVEERSSTVIEQMPRYPNDGSIKVIDGIVVIKF